MKTIEQLYNGLAGRPISFDPATPEANPYLAALERKRQAAVRLFTPRLHLTGRPAWDQYEAGGTQRAA
jgi:hypothetical protein